jgi:uncharacterized protein YbaP (TraB family)
MNIFRYIFTLLIPFSLFSQQIKPENKLLWEVTKKGSKKKSYLYGSYHTNDKRVFQFSDSVYTALNNVEIIAVETDLYALFKELDTRREEVKLNFDNAGGAYTSSKKSTVTAYGNEDGMPQFLDMFFIQYALLAQKDYTGLEPLEDQLKLTEGPMDFSGIGYADRFLNLTEKTLKVYLDGDIDAVERLLRLSLKWDPNFYTNLIVKRNQTMANSLDSLLKTKSVFAVVGAGHLSGTTGIISLLREKGYNLRPVLASYSEKATTDKKAVLSKRDYLFFDSITQLRATFPGRPFEIDKDDVTLNLIYRELGQGNTYMIEVFEQQEGQTLESVAFDYIQSPGDSKMVEGTLDFGTPYIEGISDSYPEGLSWVRVLETDGYFAVLKAYGGNKFMNSKRAQNFFNKVWFELD